jgi:ZIP family zinc transporter
MNGILTALLLTLIAGAATGIGGALVLFKKKLSSNTLAASLGLSAGVMIFISLAELLPEAQAEIVAIGSVKYGEALTLLAFFGGMGIIMLIDFLVPEYENPHEVSELSLEDGSQSSQSNKEKALHKLGILSALAIAIHNFPEGIATVASAFDDTGIATSVALAVAIHNIPEGIAVALPLLYGTGNRRKAFGWALLSGLAEPLGAMVGMLILLPFLSPALLAVLFACVAGIMIYISFDELLPMAERWGHHHLSIYGVTTGMLIMAMVL